MEELRKLEKVHSMLEFMESRGVSNLDHHSNRFLANFILFLIEPSGDLAINDKCSLLSQLIPTVSFSSTFYSHLYFLFRFISFLFCFCSSHLHSLKTRINTTLTPPSEKILVLFISTFMYRIEYSVSNVYLAPV